ncbi:MAG: hypothetical protein PHH57_08730 [Candidatus Omnitrophica bacterium]|nr:hypothetical protein [Candidatus Omnitrophota bacterium]
MGKWAKQDFSGGMNNKLEDNLIAENQCVDVQNFICTHIGRIEKRYGQAKVVSTALGGSIQGMHGFYYGATPTRKLIVASNGSVYYLDGTSWSAAIKTSLNASAMVNFVTFNDYLIAMNGVDAPWKYNGTAVSALSNAPATGKCPVIHKEKLFCMSDDETIKWSNSYLPETWTGTDVWQFDVGDGDKLTSIWSTRRALLACKQRKIFSLYGSSVLDFRAETTEPNHGVAGLRAGVVREPYFYYIDADGIMEFDGMGSINMTMNSIPDTWESVNKAYLANAVAGYNYYFNHLWFHVPESTSTTNNMVLVLDMNYSDPANGVFSWWIFRGITATCMLEYDTGSAMKVYVGSPTGYVYEQNTTYSDAGTAITAYYLDRAFDDGDPVRQKRIRQLYAVDANGLNDATFQYRKDYGSYVSPTAQTDISDVRRFRVGTTCRYFQPKFTHSTDAQSCTISGYKIKYQRGRDR